MSDLDLVAETTEIDRPVAPNRAAADLLPLFLLTLTLAAAAVAAAVAVVMLVGQTESAERVVFVCSFVLALPLAALAAFRIGRGPNAPRISELAALSSSGLLALLVVLRLTQRHAISSRAGAWILLAGVLLLIGVAIAALLLPGGARAREEAARPAWPVATAGLAAAVVPVLVFATPGDLTAGRIVVSVLIAALITVAYAFVDLPRPRRGLLIGADVLLAVLIVLVVINASGYLTEQVPGPLPGGVVSGIGWHQDFYLGPANDVVHGRALLVDVTSQYGIAPIYALAAWFKLAPIGYGTLVLFAGAVSSAMYALGYAILRLGGAGRMLAAAALAVALFALLLANPLDPALYPSVGGLRYLPPFVVVTLALLAARRSTHVAADGSLVDPRPVTFPPLLAVTAVFSLWSAEGFACVAAALGLMVLVAAATGARSLRSGMRLVGVDLLRLFVACLAAHVLFAIGTWILAGSWPDWGWYLAYISSFSVSFGPVLVTQWSAGWFVGGVYMASLAGLITILAFAPETGRRLRVELLAIAGSTGAGLGLFTYWVSRSLDVTLPPLALPAVMTVGLWLALGLRLASARRPIRLVAVGVTAWLAAVLVVVARPAAQDQWPRTALSHLLPGGRSLSGDLSRLWHSPRIDPRSRDVQRLVDERFPAGNPLLIIEPDLATESLVRSRRANLLPFGDAYEDTLVKNYTRPNVAKAIRSVRPGTLMLVERSPKQVAPAVLGSQSAQLIGPHAWLTSDQIYALGLIRRRFQLHPMADGPAGLHIVRLEPSG